MSVKYAISKINSVSRRLLFDSVDTILASKQMHITIADLTKKMLLNFKIVRLDEHLHM